MISFIIPGKPCAWQRARLSKGGRHHFTDTITRTVKNAVGWHFKKAFPGHTLWIGPVRLLVTAYFPIAKSTSQKKRCEMHSDKVWYPHKSDWDNIGKLPSDALNGVAYIDDCQVVDGRVLKYYSPRPRIEIELEELS